MDNNTIYKLIPLIIVFKAMADPTYYLDINGLSKHLNNRHEVEEKYNERNYGFGLTRENKNNRLIQILLAGGYKNSFGNPSYYAGAGLAKRFGKNNYMDVGVMGGGVSGYANKLTAMAGPFLTLGQKDKGRLRLIYLPKTDENDATVMANLGIPIR